MSLLLPPLVDGIGVLVHHVGLGDLLARLVAFLLDNFAFTIDPLQCVPLLDLVPLHHGLALGVHVLVIWDQVQSNIVKEGALMLVPEA